MKTTERPSTQETLDQLRSWTNHAQSILDQLGRDQAGEPIVVLDCFQRAREKMLPPAERVREMLSAGAASVASWEAVREFEHTILEVSTILPDFSVTAEAA